MKQFEVGKYYSCVSACDHECVWTFEVIKRTAKTVTIKQMYRPNSKEILRRPHVYDEKENILPFGSYSMAPIISAK